MNKYLLAPIVAVSLAFSSCAVFQNPVLTQAVIAAAVSTALAHTPEAQRAVVAKDINIASGLYNVLVGPDGVPSPAQFAAALEKYLPADASKPLAEAALNALYSGFYPQITDHSPKDQIAYLGTILAGFKAGAAPYVK